MVGLQRIEPTRKLHLASARRDLACCTGAALVSPKKWRIRHACTPPCGTIGLECNRVFGRPCGAGGAEEDPLWRLACKPPGLSSARAAWAANLATSTQQAGSQQQPAPDIFWARCFYLGLLLPTRHSLSNERRAPPTVRHVQQRRQIAARARPARPDSQAGGTPASPQVTDGAPD